MIEHMLLTMLVPVGIVLAAPVTLVARAIEKLVEQGYVKKAVDMHDRRRLSLSLSTPGKKVHRHVEAMISQVEADLLAEVSAADAKTFFHVMSVLGDRAARLSAPDAASGEAA